MEPESVHLVRRGFELASSGDWDGFMALMGPGVEWRENMGDGDMRCEIARVLAATDEVPRSKRALPSAASKPRLRSAS